MSKDLDNILAKSKPLLQCGGYICKEEKEIDPHGYTVKKSWDVVLPPDTVLLLVVANYTVARLMGGRLKSIMDSDTLKVIYDNESVVILFKTEDSVITFKDIPMVDPIFTCLRNYTKFRVVDKNIFNEHNF